MPLDLCALLCMRPSLFPCPCRAAAVVEEGGERAEEGWPCPCPCPSPPPPPPPPAPALLCFRYQGLSFTTSLKVKSAAGMPRDFLALSSARRLSSSYSGWGRTGSVLRRRVLPSLSAPTAVKLDEEDLLPLIAGSLQWRLLLSPASLPEARPARELLPASSPPSSSPPPPAPPLLPPSSSTLLLSNRSLASASVPLLLRSSSASLAACSASSLRTRSRFSGRPTCQDFLLRMLW